VRDGLRLALTTFTVVPVRGGRVDRATARVAMASAPLVGVLLGLVLGGAALVLRWPHPPGIVLGGVLVGVEALLTRGLHLDGLADTVDGLGSYAPRERAMAIMRSPEVGPFGVVALVLAVLIQAGCAAALATRPVLPVLAGFATAAATGRLAAAVACRRGVSAARPDGLGALVAGTTRVPELLGGTVAVGALSVLVHPWRGPLAVGLGLAGAAAAGTHAVRRLGGITGDVLGALVVIAQTLALVVLVLH
jgi:adenosylcobinamide-GDP ribazoletransferase